VLGLFPRKRNIQKPEPIGLKFEFAPEAVYVSRMEVHDVTSEGKATREAILVELAHGPASIAELTTATGAPASTVRWIS